MLVWWDVFNIIGIDPIAAGKMKFFDQDNMLSRNAPIYCSPKKSMAIVLITFSFYSAIH